MKTSILIKSAVLVVGAAGVLAASLNARAATSSSLRNYSPLMACTADALCMASPPACAKTSGTCVSTYEDTTSKFCSFTAKGVTTTTNCLCFAGEEEFCYLQDANGNWVMGTKTCNVTSSVLSSWNACVAL